LKSFFLCTSSSFGTAFAAKAVIPEPDSLDLPKKWKDTPNTTAYCWRFPLSLFIFFEISHKNLRSSLSKFQPDGFQGGCSQQSGGLFFGFKKVQQNHQKAL